MLVVENTWNCMWNFWLLSLQLLSAKWPDFREDFLSLTLDVRSNIEFAFNFAKILIHKGTRKTIANNWILAFWSYQLFIFIFGLLGKFISQPKGWITWKCTLKSINIQLSKPYINIIIHQKTWFIHIKGKKKLYCTFIEGNDEPCLH